MFQNTARRINYFKPIYSFDIKQRLPFNQKRHIVSEIMFASIFTTNVVMGIQKHKFVNKKNTIIPQNTSNSIFKNSYISINNHTAGIVEGFIYGFIKGYCYSTFSYFFLAYAAIRHIDINMNIDQQIKYGHVLSHFIPGTNSDLDDINNYYNKNNKIKFNSERIKLLQSFYAEYDITVPPSNDNNFITTNIQKTKKTKNKLFR
jgi:hypothetical protein